MSKYDAGQRKEKGWGWWVIGLMEKKLPSHVTREIERRDIWNRFNSRFNGLAESACDVAELVGLLVSLGEIGKTVGYLKDRIVWVKMQCIFSVHKLSSERRDSTNKYSHHYTHITIKMLPECSD